MKLQLTIAAPVIVAVALMTAVYAITISPDPVEATASNTELQRRVDLLNEQVSKTYYEWRTEYSTDRKASRYKKSGRKVAAAGSAAILGVNKRSEG